MEYKTTADSQTPQVHVSTHPTGDLVIEIHIENPLCSPVNAPNWNRRASPAAHFGLDFMRMFFSDWSYSQVNVAHRVKNALGIKITPRILLDSHRSCVASVPPCSPRRFICSAFL